MSRFESEENNGSIYRYSGSGIQRKNLMNAKLLDDEVQQDIFPEGSSYVEEKLSESSAVKNEMISARVRVQKDAVQDLESALGDLNSWRDTMKGSSIETSELIAVNEDAKYAKWRAFIDEELYSTTKVHQSSTTQGGLSDNSYARLQALSKREDVQEMKQDSLLGVITSNAEVVHMRSSCLGKEFMGLENLKATKNQLLAELEESELHMAELETRINSENWGEIEDL